MAALGLVKCARPESQPNKLLCGLAFPPVDSINDKLGRSRQSSANSSATIRKSTAYPAAGHSPRVKNWRKGASRGSLRYSCCKGRGRVRSDMGTGTDATPNTTSPPDNSFLIFGNLLILYSVTARQKRKRAVWLFGFKRGLWNGHKSKLYHYEQELIV